MKYKMLLVEFAVELKKQLKSERKPASKTIEKHKKQNNIKEQNISKVKQSAENSIKRTAFKTAFEK